MEPACLTARNPVPDQTITLIDPSIATAALVPAVDTVDASTSTTITHPSPDVNERVEDPGERPSNKLMVLKGMEDERDIQARPERKVEIEKRAASHEAALAYTRERMVRSPCDSCDRGSGPFRRCIRVAGLLKGSCTTCHYSTGGKGCSLRDCEQQYALNVA